MTLLNRAIFARADRILVPVTPDVPALRAAVQLREVAGELGFADKLAMVINRANSGVSVADMERTIGMPSLALIRSAGLQLVKAANEGRTVIDLFPREKVTEDFRILAERVVGAPRAKTEVSSRYSLIVPLRAPQGVGPRLTADGRPARGAAQSTGGPPMSARVASTVLRSTCCTPRR